MKAFVLLLLALSQASHGMDQVDSSPVMLDTVGESTAAEEGAANLREVM